VNVDRGITCGAVHRNRLARVGLFSLILMFMASMAMASDKSMRCSGNLIYAGGGKDSALMYEVLRKCGEPVSKQGDQWVYVQGNMQRVLTFRPDGRLQQIESRRR